MLHGWYICQMQTKPCAVYTLVIHHPLPCCCATGQMDINMTCNIRIQLSIVWTELFSGLALSYIILMSGRYEVGLQGKDMYAVKIT